MNGAFGEGTQFSLGPAEIAVTPGNSLTSWQIPSIHATHYPLGETIKMLFNQLLLLHCLTIETKDKILLRTHVLHYKCNFVAET